jgi:hypothetical protein
MAFHSTISFSKRRSRRNRSCCSRRPISAGGSQTIVLNPVAGQLLFADASGNLLGPDTMINFATGYGSYLTNLPSPPSISAAAGGIQINLIGATNASYILQSSTDLATWTSIATNALFNTTVYFSDTNTTLPCKFYRVTQ